MPFLRRVWFATALATFLTVADTVAKVATQIALPTGRVVVFPKVLSLFLHYNAGLVANAKMPMPIIVAVTLAVLVGCAVWLRAAWRMNDTAVTIGLILILYGGIGNLTDRLADAHTTDYLLLFEHSVANISDGLVLAGILWLVVISTRKNNRGRARFLA
ncbi:MAG: signal peptidase II [Patescibacteria group bacterium]